MSTFPRIYTSFSEFERDELRKLDSLTSSVEDLLDDSFAQELGMEESPPKQRRRRHAS